MLLLPTTKKPASYHQIKLVHHTSYNEPDASQITVTNDTKIPVSGRTVQQMRVLPDYCRISRKQNRKREACEPKKKRVDRSFVIRL